MMIHKKKYHVANIGPRTNPGTAKKSYGSGKETLRLRANGPARVEEAVSLIILFLFFNVFPPLFFAFLGIENNVLKDDHTP